MTGVFVLPFFIFFKKKESTIMSPKFSAYHVILWFSFQLLVNCQIIPQQRQWHTATYIDDKLYIMGGAPLDNITIGLNDFFYIDVSGPFNTNKLSWQNLSDNTIPGNSGAATIVG